MLNILYVDGKNSSTFRCYVMGHVLKLIVAFIFAGSITPGRNFFSCNLLVFIHRITVCSMRGALSFVFFPFIELTGEILYRNSI